MYKFKILFNINIHNFDVLMIKIFNINYIFIHYFYRILHSVKIMNKDIINIKQHETDFETLIQPYKAAIKIVKTKL